MQISYLLPLILFVPFLSALLLGVAALVSHPKEEGLSESLISFLAVGAPAISAVLTLILFFQQLTQPELIWQFTLGTWIRIPAFELNMGLRMDHLSGLMTAMITFIGTLIHLFSVAYMRKDRGFARYFAYLNLFFAAMLLLILSDNIVGLFMGWEGVGVCSYLLIGFWFKDLAKAQAGTKAFVVNRVGDFGFMLGILFLFLETRAFSFDAIQSASSAISPAMLSIIGILLLIGAMGKSAQIPLHVWLPDAMAGPTPVSALIHAATMVTAGVYMVARMNFLYSQTPSVSFFIVLMGALTAFVAATIALVQTDIKKVLAYSTVSQLGYMFMGVGAGAYAAGIFHVFTHAFFKAALFLGAGAIIHCLHHEQDLRKMGGLRKRLPVTHFAMLVSCLAISGIPPFAGFFSKDEILFSLWDKGLYAFWALGLITAGLTAFYMFRLYFLAFGSEYRGSHDVDAEPLLMKLPLLLLAVGAIFTGFLGLPATLGLPNWFEHFMAPVVGGHHPEASVALVAGLMGVSVLAAAIGIGVARQRYASITEAPALAQGPLAEVLHQKYGFDLLYEEGIVRPLKTIGYYGWQIGDRILIGGAIQFGQWVYKVVSLFARFLHFGNVRAYGHYLIIGLFIIFYLYFALHFPGVFSL